MSETYSLLAKGVDAHFDANGRILVYIMRADDEPKRQRELWVKALRGLNGQKVKVTVETAK